MTNKTFDRGVCFTFFADFRKTAKDLESDFGKEIVADYYNLIADYALYGIEHETNGTLKYIWHTTKTLIDKNIERRSSGFRENTEQTEKIKKFKDENPEATQRTISKATGISLGKVNKVLKNSSNTDTNTNTNTNTNTDTNSITIHEREHEPIHDSQKFATAEIDRKRELDELSDEELLSIKSDYTKRIEYVEIKKRLNLNRQVTKDTVKEVEKILSERALKVQRDNLIKNISALQDSKISILSEFLRCEKKEVTDYLLALGVDAEYMLRWIPVYKDIVLKIFESDEYKDFRETRGYDTYFMTVKKVLDANKI